MSVFDTRAGAATGMRAESSARAVTRRRGTLEGAIHVVLIAAFLLTRLRQFAAASSITFPDSTSFLVKAGAPLDHTFFLGEGRLFAVPLLWSPALRASGGSHDAVAWLQLVLSCASWLVLAFAVARPLRGAVARLAALVLVLAFAASSEVAAWDRTLLSESVSTSLFAFLMAAWLWWGERWRAGAGRGAALVVGLLAALWGFARESNGLFLLLLASVAMIVALLDPLAQVRRRRLQAVALAVLLATVFALAQSVAERGERWLFPLLNVIGRRVLPSPERTAFYVAAGMPVTPRLEAMRGEFASGQDWAFYQAPELASFRDWVHARGRHTYLRDLTLHPVRTLGEPLVDARQLVCPDLQVYRPPGYEPGAADRLWTSLCPDATARALPGVALAAGVLLALSAVLARDRVSSRGLFVALTTAALLVAWPVLTWLTWHAIGEMEVGRHVLWATLLLRLGVILGATSLLDALLDGRRAVRGPGVALREPS